MRLVQGPQRRDASEARTRVLRSRVKHSTAEPLCSRHAVVSFYVLSFGEMQRVQTLVRCRLLASGLGLP